MQGLGEWILYLDYKDGMKDEILLKDYEAHDLYMYIKQNGNLVQSRSNQPTSSESCACDSNVMSKTQTAREQG